MIRIQIETNGVQGKDGLYKENPTQGEVAMVVYQLEKIKNELLELEFDNTAFELQQDGI